MAGYATNASMATLLLAMKEKALQDTSQLKYLSNVRITSRGYWPPWDSPMLYLMPIGTIEVREAEYLKESMIMYTHIVQVECVYHTMARGDTEEAMIGSSAEIGLVPFVEDVLSFYENNFLGLSSTTGITPGVAPIIESSEDTYTQLTLDDTETVFFNIARLRYTARMMPHKRPTDT